MKSLVPAPPAHDHTAIPIYQLYGYGNTWTTPDPFFCETIAAQEKLHNWHVQPHKHVDLYQVLYLESGQMEAWLDGRVQAIDGGHLILVPQQVVHEFLFRPGCSGYILTLTRALLSMLCQHFVLGLQANRAPAVLRLKETGEDRLLALLFAQLDAEYRALPQPQRGPLLEAMLGGILVWIHRHGPAGRAQEVVDPGSRHLARYARLIEDHFRERHQVAWYAGTLGVTPAHLNSLCQSLTGKAALQMIHERLLLEARRELIYTARSVALVADSLGFSDPAYFARFFRRLTGDSPRDFRQLRRLPEGSAAARVVRQAAPARA